MRTLRVCRRACVGGYTFILSCVCVWIARGCIDSIGVCLLAARHHRLVGLEFERRLAGNRCIFLMNESLFVTLIPSKQATRRHPRRGA